MNMTVFYVPSLQRRSVQRELPADLVFFPSGLRESDLREEEPSTVIEARRAVATALPLSAGEARAVLDELLRLGEELSPNGLLRQLAAEEATIVRGGKSLLPDEAAALGAFAASGAVSSDGGVTRSAFTVPDWGGLHRQSPAERVTSVRETLINCQKVLLLADSLETRAAELALLEQRYRDAQAALAATLSDGAEKEAGKYEIPPPANKGKAPAEIGLGVPWRVLVDAALPFLPDKTLLFTADPVMTADLKEAGMLQPFPEDRAGVCASWSQHLASGLLFACLPAWRLVGRQALPENRPWLNRDIEVVVARPVGGWI